MTKESLGDFFMKFLKTYIEDMHVNPVYATELLLRPIEYIALNAPESMTREELQEIAQVAKIAVEKALGIKQ